MKEPETGSCVVAIDGPAASGKSSVARELARRLGLVHVNSGLMYRAATRAVLEEGIAPADGVAVSRYFQDAGVSCEVKEGGALVITIGGKPRVGLAEDDVNAHVSAVASVPEVRQKMVALQREIGAEQPTVMEGRDIGSVVFKETPFKFYIDASEEVRAQRRAAQGQVDAIGERDRADSNRAASPLVVAEDATVIDTSTLTIEEVVQCVMDKIEKTRDRVGGAEQR